MKNVKDIDILETIGQAAVLEQLAEEAAELSQAALKLARIQRGENPTPVTEKKAIANLHEELADVLLCADILADGENISYEGVDSFVAEKYERWQKRLAEVIEKDNIPEEYREVYEYIKREFGEDIKIEIVEM